MLWPATLLAALLSASHGQSIPTLFPRRPSATDLLAARMILPNGTLIRDGERLRTLELDELAPLRLRWTIRF